MFDIAEIRIYKNISKVHLILLGRKTAEIQSDYKAGRQDEKG
jgi:hypothetical protein